MSAAPRFGRTQVAQAFGATLRAARLQRGVSHKPLRPQAAFAWLGLTPR